MQRFIRRKGKPSGHTYLELMATVVVLAIMAKVALPKYADSMRRYQLEAAAKRVAADLEFARENAKTRGASQQVVFTLSTSSYTLPGMQDPGHAGRPYSVQLATGDYPATLAQLNFGASGTEGTITFDMYGRPDYPGSLTIQVGTSQKVVLVDAWGRTIIN